MTPLEPEAALGWLLGQAGAPRRHLHGDLASHLRGTHALLVAWDASPAVAMAGLIHAAYGTDGFAHPIARPDRRDAVAAIVGSSAEALVYLYAAADRAAFHAAIIAETAPGCRDRFTGRRLAPSPEDLAAFCEITLANELDLMGRSDRHWALYGADLAPLFTAPRFRARVSTRGLETLDRLMPA